MKKIVITLLFLLFAYLIYNVSTYPNFDKIERESAQHDAIGVNDVNWKETYENDVKLDLKNNAYLIGNNVSRAKYYTSRFLHPKIIGKNDSKKLVMILNDSSSYVWGERGTPEFDSHLVFLDSNNTVIGVTKIDIENSQTQTDPYLRTRKWGYLSELGKNRLSEIIPLN